MAPGLAELARLATVVFCNFERGKLGHRRTGNTGKPREVTQSNWIDNFEGRELTHGSHTKPRRSTGSVILCCRREPRGVTRGHGGQLGR